MFFLFSLSGYGQTNLLKALNSSNVLLSSEEQATFSKVQQNPKVTQYWHISISPIENVLNGHSLSLTLPESASSTNFTADYAFSATTGSYNWTGYNIDGSEFRVVKNSLGYLGNIYIASTNKHYGILSLSTSKFILVKYDNSMFAQDGCGTAAVADDETNDVVTDRGACEINKIRVLFLSTPAIQNAFPSPLMVSKAVIDELNAMCIASGLLPTDVFFEFAGHKLLSGFVEDLSDIGLDLNQVTNNLNAKSYRNTYYADIVVLLTGPHSSGVVGIANIGASNAKAYCAAELIFASTSFTASHEIGHTLGARHQRCAACFTPGCDDATNGHGFIISPVFRTVMAQTACTTTRVGRISNPSGPLFMGLSTGDNGNNNAKKIKDRASKVACFRAEPPSTGSNPIAVSVAGPTSVCNQGYYSYSSTVFTTLSAIYPLTYLWEISPIGVGNWTSVGTGSSCVLTNPSTWPNYWMTLRLTVTDAVGQNSAGFIEIKRGDCVEGGASERSVNVQDTQPLLFPNPASDYLQLEGVSNESTIRVFGLDGWEYLMDLTVNTGENNRTLQTTQLPAGMYFLEVNDHQKQSFNKIRFIKL